ncbi:hypothetical protein M422DRAFT_34688 [Sphaerobolus stellatus SS14]|uniref:Uncharacterized protein n=1 Tax=Sphaerobolus stellatus (strain SS14) TaxID=990650 RepID=A0A0C9V0Z2_SPHS4|nr:hypothetical protein M422DRAFT_34688 [Sphaerobolus stellatus SS14]
MSVPEHSRIRMPSTSSSSRRATVGSSPYEDSRTLSRHERRAHPYDMPRRASFNDNNGEITLEHLVRGYPSPSGSHSSDSPVHTPAQGAGTPSSRTATLAPMHFMGSPAHETKPLINPGHEYSCDPFNVPGFSPPMNLIHEITPHPNSNNIHAYPMLGSTNSSAPRGLGMLGHEPTSYGFFHDPHALPPASPSNPPSTISSPHMQGTTMDENDPASLRRRLRELEFQNDLIREHEAKAQARISDLEDQIQQNNFSNQLLLSSHHQQSYIETQPYNLNASSAASVSRALGPAPSDWHARTQYRIRRFCSLNRAGNALCAWHDSRRERRQHPPRMAPPDTLNCGCSYKEALFEEALARHGVGSYLPGESVRMDPVLRNGLLKLLEGVYGYRDGDFERTQEGGWKEGEDSSSWERRAVSRPPRRAN